MLSFIIRRFLYMIPLLFIISIFAFTIVKLQPSDIVAQWKFNPSIGRDLLESLIRQFDLDKDPVTQYITWLRNIFTKGDLGFSFFNKVPVEDYLFGGGALLYSMVIILATMLFTWLIAIPIGIYSATHKYSFNDHFLNFMGFLGLSIPVFLLAIVFLQVMVSILRVGSWCDIDWLRPLVTFFRPPCVEISPGVFSCEGGILCLSKAERLAQGYYSAPEGLAVGGLFANEYALAPWSWAKFRNFLWHLWPVVIIVGTANIAALIRYMRANLLDVLGQPYVQTARAKGLSERVVIYKHAVRNAINPLVSMLGFWIPFMFEGMLVASAVMNLQTVEVNYFNALSTQDQWVIMGGLLYFGVILVVGNLISDILLAVVDPKIRYD
ncbi:MAG: ABC transporter permease [Candidatus Bipolaricaulota bacterium]|nr:ABC transporter permease [Candidatus Bipolaricaulota bacterium]MDW8140808.1 ABC transporter permease [Candidatus Bipolaricaulota bacterium]